MSNSDTPMKYDLHRNVTVNHIQARGAYKGDSWAFV
jgi:hypothetical protein